MICQTEITVILMPKRDDKYDLTVRIIVLRKPLLFDQEIFMDILFSSIFVIKCNFFGY